MPKSDKKKGSRKKPPRGGKAAEVVVDQAAAPEVVYPERKFANCVGENALTAVHAKALLGWEEETDDVKFTDAEVDPAVTALYGARVRMKYNTKNRPIELAPTKSLIQSILGWHGGKRVWQYNGDTIVVGKTGQVVQGQKRLVALVCAEKYRKDPSQSGHWESLGWRGPVSIETAVVYGVEEDDATFQTFNCVQPATGADVIYRSDFFRGKDVAVRKEMSRALDWAVRLLWDRLGPAGKLDPYSPNRTPAETMDFLRRHPRLKDAVEYVAKKNAKGAVARVLPPGTAAGLLYLMAAGCSDGDAYRDGHPPSENLLDFKVMVDVPGGIRKVTVWEAAEFFWRDLALGAKCTALREVPYYLASLAGLEGEGRATVRERIAVVVKAWQQYVQGLPVGPHSDCTENNYVAPLCLRLTYVPRPDGGKKLAESPTCGGIDWPGEVLTVGEVEAGLEDVGAAITEASAAKQSEENREVDLAEESGLVTPKSWAEMTLAEQLADLKANHEGLLLFHLPPDGDYLAYGGDAVTVAQVCNVGLHRGKNYPDGLDRTSFRRDYYDKAVGKLLKAGYEVKVCTQAGGSISIAPAAEPVAV